MEKNSGIVPQETSMVAEQTSSHTWVSMALITSQYFVVGTSISLLAYGSAMMVDLSEKKVEVTF